MQIPENKVAHICGWREIDESHRVSLHLLGNKPDVLRPPRKPKNTPEYMRDYRQRKKQLAADDVELSLEIELAKRARKALAQPIFRHPMDVAFFGPAERRAA